MKKIIFLTLISFFGFSQTVLAYTYAGETEVGRITKVYVDYDYVFITFSGSLTDCNSEGLYLGEPGVINKSQLNRLLATAQLAYATGKNVRLRYYNGDDAAADGGWSLCYAGAIWLQE